MKENNINECQKSLTPEIRILPMSKNDKDFKNKSIEEVQKSYFLAELPNENKGKYYFLNKSIDTPANSLVLFQYDSHIIASALLKEKNKYDKPDKDGYSGHLEFEKESINIFLPISLEELKEVDPSIKKFSQSYQRIEYSKINQIKTLIAKKQEVIYNNEEELIDKEHKEGSCKTITINTIERNYQARMKCIKEKGSNCTICGFDFGEVYGKEFKDKIHVHHIVPLSTKKEEYIVTINDLIPVCPNCHMIIHSKKDGIYSEEEMKEMINKNKVSKD